MKNLIQKIISFVLVAVVCLATVLFFMVLFVRTEEVTALLAESLAYVLFEIVLSKPGIGIIAFMLGAILVMAWGGNRMAKAEMEIAHLKKEGAEKDKKIQGYEARDAAQLKEYNKMLAERPENGMKILNEIQSA